MSYEFPRDPLSGPVICHRGACKATVEPLDAWFNIGNGMWYCAECAKLINDLSFSGKPLCFIPPYEEVAPCQTPPLYKHDCEGCRFWGTFEVKHGETTRQADFYTCNAPSDLVAYVQIVVRFGDDGPHYTSGEFLASDLMRWKPGLELFKPVYAYVYRLSRGLPLE